MKIEQPGTGGSGGNIMLETNGVLNGSQTLLNLISGTGITVADNEVGGITIASTGGTQTLAQTLALGNTSGGTNLIISNGDNLNLAGQTASTIAGFDASKNIISLSTSTYPSLTELSYVKGVTSSIQTQLNSKGSGTVTSVSGTTNRITSTGGTTPVIDISASYIGQTSITTLGTITTGVWNGTAISNANLANSTISGIALGSNLASLTATDTTLTFSGAYNGGTARTVGINLTTANTWTGIMTLSPTARSSGSASYFTINDPADTGITANTESKGINIVGSTRTWSDGTVTTQREYFFGAPTYNKTTTSAVFTNAYSLYIEGNPIAGSGVTITNPFALGVGGNIYQNGRYTKLGNASPNNTVLSAGPSPGGELWGTDNTINGVVFGTGNTSNGTSAYNGFFLNNDLAVSNDFTHFAGMFLNSSGYTDTTFGTAFAVANQFIVQNTDGPIVIVANKSSASGIIQFFSRGTATTNEVGQFNNAGLIVGLTGTLTGAIKFAGSTSTQITLQGQAAGLSGVLTLPAATDTLVGKATTDTLTNKTLTAPTITAPVITGIGTADLISPNNNAVSVSSNAGTCSQSFELNTFTNSSAATMTITLGITTPTPKDGQKMIVRIYDASGVAQTISWVNTENSSVTVPTTSNGSTTSYLAVTFQYNGATSKWRCMSVN